MVGYCWTEQDNPQNPKIRHRFYKNGTAVSRITSEADPANGHGVAKDRAAWKPAMWLDVPPTPTTAWHLL